MGRNLIVGLIFLILGILVLIRGLRHDKSAMAGLKFRGLFTGILLIIVGLPGSVK